MSQRLNNVRDAMKERRLDGLLISAPENRRYLSGFVGTAGYLIITQRDAVLATDFRYIEQAGRQAPDFRVARVSGPNLDWFSQTLAETGISKLGFESDHLTVAIHRRLSRKLREHNSQAAARVSMVATAGITEEIRATKESAEIASLQRAIDISDGAMDAVTPTIQPGQTEEEVALGVWKWPCASWEQKPWHSTSSWVPGQTPHCLTTAPGNGSWRKVNL